jgi:hypothetical protein
MKYILTIILFTLVISIGYQQYQINNLTKELETRTTEKQILIPLKEVLENQYSDEIGTNEAVQLIIDYLGIKYIPEKNETIKAKITN